MTTEPKIERKGLAIISVEPVKEVGSKGAKKLQFKAKEKAGREELTYFTFRPSLFETIEKGIGQVLDCETETSSRERDGNTFTDRKVNQIFVDGQPIGGQKKQFGFAGYQHSPEERASIETQVAAKIGSELLAAKVIPVESAFGQAVIQWCLARLSGKPVSQLKPEPISLGRPGVDKPAKTPFELETEKQIDELWGEEKKPEPIYQPIKQNAGATKTPAKKPALESKPSPPKEAGNGKVSPPPSSSSPDLVWLGEKLDILKGKAPKAWGPANLLALMKMTYKVEGANPLEVAKKLDEGQLAHFVQKVKEALEIS